jgi:hypothetical protein
MSNIPLLSYEMVGYSLYKNSIKPTENSDHNIVNTNVDTNVDTNINSSDTLTTSVATSVATSGEEPVCKSSSQPVDIESVIGLVVEDFFCYDILTLESFFSIFL